jgi:hypothetical protein
VQKKGNSLSGTELQRAKETAAEKMREKQRLGMNPYLMTETILTATADPHTQPMRRRQLRPSRQRRNKPALLQKLRIIMSITIHHIASLRSGI